MAEKYYKELRFYKPRKEGNGAASKFQLNIKDGTYGEEHLLFLEMAQQTGVDDKENASFGWKDNEKKIIFKMEENDIGECLAVLVNEKKAAGNGKGIYHETQKGNTILYLSRIPGKEGFPDAFGIKLSSKKKGDTQGAVVQHMLTLAEAQVLKVYLTKALEKKYGL